MSKQGYIDITDWIKKNILSLIKDLFSFVIVIFAVIMMIILPFLVVIGIYETPTTRVLNKREYESERNVLLFTLALILQLITIFTIPNYGFIFYGIIYAISLLFLAYTIFMDYLPCKFKEELK